MNFTKLIKPIKRTFLPPYHVHEVPVILGTVVLFLSLLLSVALLQTDTNTRGHAATANSVEPESGTVTGNVTIISDPNASGGKYVRFSNSSPSVTGRYVFAHYMLAMPTHDDTVNGFKQDIQEAQAIGIDGFALNAGGWGTSNYVTRATNMYEAAKELNTNFKLFISSDWCCGITEDDAYDMVRRFYDHPNQFKVNGMSVFSTFSGQDNTWWSAWKQTLASEGHSVYFVPGFFSSSYASQSYVDGLFYFGGDGTATDLASSNNSWASVVDPLSKTYMAGLTPSYWGQRQPPSYRYFEQQGGEGINYQWDNIINHMLTTYTVGPSPKWVEIVTWNDFVEDSYITPIQNVGSLPYGSIDNLHAGAYGIMKYYIQWYKTGVKPAITNDSVYFFYRTQSKNAFPVEFHGDVEDDIYVTTMLTSPAQLKVNSGGTVTSYNVTAGLAFTRIPFHFGSQTVTLMRNGTVLGQKTGANIDGNPTSMNYSVFSDYFSL